MPVSYSTVTTSKMELTPMRVSANGVDLGGTLNNVVVSIEVAKSPIKADQSGETIRDRRISGQVYKVTTTLTQIRDNNTWKTAFPHMKKVTSGGNSSIYVQAGIGASDLDSAVVLLLHPLSLANADLSGDFKFYKATPMEVSEITYGPTAQAGLKVEWQILPDDSVQPERFFIHGDPTIGLVAASAGSAVPGSNTGNGTVSGISVFNGFTQTENVTLTCVGVPGSNQANFEVAGSLSGPHGIAALGVGFSCPVIALTINDGTTDFVIGDSFTIATVAANYA